MRVWQYAYHKARIGTWREEYLNRTFFQLRIKKGEDILSPILNSNHRQNVERRLSSTLDFNLNDTYSPNNKTES